MSAKQREPVHRYCYKCRSCGVVVDGLCGGEELVYRYILQVITYGKVDAPGDGFASQIRMNGVHDCEGGGFGITDLIGTKIDKQEKL